MINKGPYHLAIWLIPITLLLVALAKLPYGYYQFLKIIVCFTAGYLSYQEYKRKNRFNG